LTTGAAVTYSKYAGTEVSLGDKELVILKEDDVIGVLGGGPDDWAKLQPLGDRVLLQAVDAIKETAGGVILASDEVERPTLGKVRCGVERWMGWGGSGQGPTATHARTALRGSHTNTSQREG
jgi:co-chaperonin GroES (HSP10)